ncbi:MAG TPA: nuclear transport factor 2 family protein [Anaerolineales bacterium]
MFSIKSKFFSLLLILAIALTACSSTSKVAATPTPDRSPDVRANMEKYNQYFVQTNADGMASLFASNGELVDSGLVLASGPDAIRTYLNQSFSAAHLDSLITTIDSIVINGNVAVVVGKYDEKWTDPNQSYELKLRYVGEWIVQSNGQWLLNRVSTLKLPQSVTGTP